MPVLIRSRAPLRLGLAGGGTDVSPYSEQFGGCVLSATVNLYAYCTLEPSTEGIEFVASDLHQSETFEANKIPEVDGNLLLHKAVYNRVVRDFTDGTPFRVKVTTYSDAPPGSGLGSSSTVVVAMLQAYQRYLGLPLGEYDIAHMAYEIERIECRLSGGKQDQYAAAFGGFNFMEFFAGDKVIVNPLRLRRSVINELESRILLYFTGTSRDSAKIINEQISATSGTDNSALDSLHDVKKYAYMMKESILRGEIDIVSSILLDAWEAKKRTSSSISNSLIEKLALQAQAAGASSLKVSGAGGGGFMLLMTDPSRKADIISALKNYEGYFVNFSFTEGGAESWATK